MPSAVEADFWAELAQIQAESIGCYSTLKTQMNDFLPDVCNRKRKDPTTKALSFWSELHCDIIESVRPDLVGTTTDLYTVDLTKTSAIQTDCAA